MAYLIDACCFIEARDRYFPFDICPGFWDWLDKENEAGNVFSIDQVYAELQDRNDDLADWAKQRSSTLFLPSDNTITASMSTVGQWLVSRPSTHFTRPAVNTFMRRADPFLVAHALANSHTVVTEETPNNPNQINKVKIPTVCQHFKIPCITLHEALRATGATLILSQK
jgi:hypothetical protein